MPFLQKRKKILQVQTVLQTSPEAVVNAMSEDPSSQNALRKEQCFAFA